MQFRRLLTVSLLLLVAACGDKFPYPPQYVTYEDIGSNALPNPPRQGSAEFEKEIQSIVKRQAKLTDVQKATLHSEDHIAPDMIIYPVLKKHYTAEEYPALATLLGHAASDAWRVSDMTQDFWKSPRPWYADNRVQLLVPNITRPGYPSGHTTTNTVWAHVLSELFPKYRQEFFARAMEIGGHRIDGGAHFPHDVKGGRRMGNLIYSKIKQSPQFQAELAAAKAEIAAKQ